MLYLVVIILLQLLTFDVGMIDSESINTVTSGEETFVYSDDKLNEQTKTSLSIEKEIEELHESEDERQSNPEIAMQEFPVEGHHHGPSLFDCNQGCFTNKL